MKRIPCNVKRALLQAAFSRPAYALDVVPVVMLRGDAPLAWRAIGLWWWHCRIAGYGGPPSLVADVLGWVGAPTSLVLTLVLACPWLLTKHGRSNNTTYRGLRIHTRPHARLPSFVPFPFITHRQCLCCLSVPLTQPRAYVNTQQAPPSSLR